jgi:hypothetical protein
VGQRAICGFHSAAAESRIANRRIKIWGEGGMRKKEKGKKRKKSGTKKKKHSMKKNKSLE